jgi:hypothetical protein
MRGRVGQSHGQGGVVGGQGHSQPSGQSSPPQQSQAHDSSINVRTMPFTEHLRCRMGGANPARGAGGVARSSRL